MKSEQKNAIRTVINTLNTVEVKGRENMNHLLGAIMVLEQMLAQPDEQEPEIRIEEVAPDAENTAE
jgi:hypothetical protein